MNVKIPKDDVGWTELLVRCSCHDVGHQISFGYFDNEPSLYVEIIAVNPKLPFFKRIRRAIRQIFCWYDENNTSIVFTRKEMEAVKDFIEDAIVDTDRFYDRFSGAK